MFEFNPDGSIKLPESLAREKELEKKRLTQGHCIKVRKDIVDAKPPKLCRISIILSDKFTDNRFIDNIYKGFMSSSEVQTKLVKINEKEFAVDIGTSFRRCSDCKSLISRYRDFLDGNMIEDKGTCTCKERSDFSYEDYFD